MSKLLTFFAFCFFTTTTLTAQLSLTVLDPHRTWTQRTSGIITSPEITVTPSGAYAQVDMVFTINADPSYKATDSLEAVMTFDLPEGSYMHDSWLWLNETVVIRAAMIEKNRAINIYEGIVQRRRDPSLLYKTSANSYKLNVYPLATSYPRKVKLSYTTPLKWQDGNSTVGLPLHLFTCSQTLPDVIVKVNKDASFSTPSFTGNSYSNYFISTTPNEDVLMIRAGDYKSNSFNLKYASGVNSSKLYIYPTGNNNGVYQLIVPSSSFGANKKTTNTVFVIDHPTTSKSIYTLDEVKQKLKSALLTNYGLTDSFNVFYQHNGHVVQAFSSWQNVDPVNINIAINSMPTAILTNPTLYENLIETAMSFCATKPGIDGQVVLLSNSSNYSNSQAAVNTMFDSIKAHLGGSFQNKVHVVNYSTFNTIVSGTFYKANDIWYSKLILATGGTLYKYDKYLYQRIGNQYIYIYDLNMTNALSEIAENSGGTTAFYNVDIKANNGIVYAPYNLHPVNRLNMSRYYVETGRYTGTISPGSVVDIQVLSGNNIVQIQDTIRTVSTGDFSLVRGWTHHFISELISKNTGAYTQEIIDSSRNNRVLCDYTAFLALETGDTINSNFDDNPNVFVHIGKQPEVEKMTVKCYPNPFSNTLTIEFPDEVELIEVFDLTGRKVFSYVVEQGKNAYTWNGKDNNGNDLPSGMYMIVGHTATERFTTKVMKQ